MRVLMLGPDLSVKGGVSSVIKLILKHSSVDITHLPTMHDRTLFGRLRHWIVRIVTWPFVSKFKRPDVVHIHFSHSLSTWRKLILARCWKFSGVSVILHSHSSDYREYYPKLPKILRNWVSKSISKADKLIVLSDSWKSFYKEKMMIDEDKIEVMFNPIEIPENIVQFEELSNIILFSGRIGKRKGAFNLIEAWNRLDSKIVNNFKLVITGDGEIKKAKSLVKNLGLESSISILGWVDDEKLSELFATSSIYILPSLNEGLPMGLLEAMSYGKSSIVTPVGGIPEIIFHGENGYLLKSGSVEDISIGLKALILDEDLRKSTGLKARKSAESISVVNYASKLDKIWEQLFDN